MNESHHLPREIAPGVFWLGACLEMSYQGRPLHGYNSAYLVAGSDCSIMVEAGHPKDAPVIEAQLAGLLSGGLPELRYVFTTHTETPHAGGLGRLLAHYPDVLVYGDGLELPLVFPQYAQRFRRINPGDELDLGGSRFVFAEAVIRDLPYSRWGFDTSRHVLFPGDGFAYSHYHEDGHCGLLAEEAGSLDIPDMTALFAELALYWTRFTDIEPYVRRLEELIDDLGVEVIAPTHGLPIGDIDQVLPEVLAGLRLGSAAGGGASPAPF